ncbi:MAG TPA: four helix bundle protein [Pyrinomonadaceae bacterium]|nr:four helix bundle protein [Pyrinomonadaceae bacterium]
MTEKEMLRRTKAFALRIMKLVDALPKTAVGRAIGGQLVRSGTSVPANYRAACRGRSKAEFIAKLGIVEEEADESGLWLELIMEGGLMDERLVKELHKEAGEITAIVSASKKTARERSQIANRKSKIK